MIVEVLLFAGPREAVGSDRLAIDARDGCTYGELKAMLADQPAIAPWISISRFAADGRFVDDTQRVRDGAEIALVPPVSGG